ncbi:MAG: pyridoxal phosphate-dependent aminotransferase [Chloroflexi bacterium]|nr:pyridoxal phosphate-dependent aminotransferase [Chloroflexota bacterium]MYK61480.1 pyridoxal phosphate-dependent aminotransferase [Chloroflexota bacterium]
MAISKLAREQMQASSWIRRMFEEGMELKTIHGPENVFDLSLGNPLLEPPPEFKQALAEIAQEPDSGLHRYMPNPGFIESRAAVAEALTEESGTNFEPTDIIMTVGAAGAINVALRALLDPGDEVIIIAPYFAEYIFYIQHANGIYREAQSTPDFIPDLNSLTSLINDRTRAIIINSPNNPSGVIYPESVIADIAKILQSAETRYGTEIYLITDEPYRKLIYTDDPYPFVFKHHVRTIVATSHSKDLGLAGERIGYMAVNPDDPGKVDLLDASVFMLRTLGFVNAPAIMQRLVSKLQRSSVDMSQYLRKRDIIHTGLTKIGYECNLPDGGFYLFPKSPMPDDVAFVNLLKSKLVLVVPGVGFGMGGYFRASYCVEDEVLHGSLDGFAEAFKEASAGG